MLKVSIKDKEIRISGSKTALARAASSGLGKLSLEFSLLFRNGAPDRIRTCDLRLRRATLYPAELRVPREGD